MWIQLDYKCKFCYKDLSVIKDDVISVGNVFSHFNCYVKDKFNSQDKLTIDECENLAREVQKNDKVTNLVKEKDKFYNWLQDAYGLLSVPTSTIKKFEDTLNGIGIGLQKPLSVEYLFDMWREQKNDLDVLYAENLKRGKEFNSTRRLHYDLAVMLNKYDGYVNVRVKRAAAIIEKESQESKKLSRIYAEMAAQQRNAAQNRGSDLNDRGFDFLEVMDEIFGTDE